MLLLLTLAGTTQGNDVRISRLEIQSPWSGFYYEGQGVQYWGKAVVNNTSSTRLSGATVRFEFFDPIGPRETFNQPLPSVQPGGTVSVETPQWWDYSGADIGMKVSVIGKDAGPPLAESTTGIRK